MSVRNQTDTSNIFFAIGAKLSVVSMIVVFLSTLYQK
ncbi:hypothetical protein SMU105_07777 [Streptococcus mutans SF12]|nr:hypothetical protein SMU105_07777 [Streptococcus mutans SF12]